MQRIKELSLSFYAGAPIRLKLIIPVNSQYTLGEQVEFETKS